MAKVAPPVTLIVNVSWGDIDEGMPGIDCECALARATLRAAHSSLKVDPPAPYRVVSASISAGRCLLMGFERRDMWLVLPQRAVSFVNAFDAKLPVEPTQFVLREEVKP